MDERNITDQLKHQLTQLGAAEPDDARIEAARQRVSARLTRSTPAGSQAAPNHRPWRTVGVGVAFAALVAIAASLAFLPPRFTPVQQASAAERLKQVIAKNQEYEGWVFQTWPGQEDQGLLYHTETGAFLTRDRLEDEHEPDAAPRYVTEGIDLERHLLFRHVGPVNVVVYSLPSPQWRRYRYAREVSRASVLEEIGQWLERDAATVLEQDRAATGEDIYRVVYYERVYDDEGHTTGRTETVLGRQEYWVDPETGLLRQVRSLTPEGGEKTVNIFTYGDTAEQVLAAFWPPEDAVVIDGRPDEATQALIDTVYGYIESGLGGGVWTAVKHSTIRDEAQEVQGVQAGLKLLARSPRGMAELSYDLRGVSEDGRVAGALPQDLFEIAEDTNAVRAAADRIPPRDVWRSDGRVFWRYQSIFSDGEYDDFDYATSGRITYPVDLSLNELSLHCAAGHAWLGAFGKPWFHNHGAEVSRVEDAARPGLVGLRVVERTSMSPLWVSDQDTWWFDPARNHVLVEIEKINFAPLNAGQAPAASSIERTVSTAFGQTAEGLWYPSAWRREVQLREGTTGDAWMDWINTEGRLIHNPDAELDPMWFGDPRAAVRGWLAEMARPPAAEDVGE